MSTSSSSSSNQFILKNTINNDKGSSNNTSYNVLNNTDRKSITNSNINTNIVDNKLLDNKLLDNKLLDNKLLDNKLLDNTILDSNKPLLKLSYLSVNQFVIGTSINQILKLIKLNYLNDNNINILYNLEYPYSNIDNNNICIKIKELNINLIFNIYSQLLQFIEIYDIYKCNFIIDNKNLINPSSNPYPSPIPVTNKLNSNNISDTNDIISSDLLNIEYIKFIYGNVFKISKFDDHTLLYQFNGISFIFEARKSDNFKVLSDTATRIFIFPGDDIFEMKLVKEPANSLVYASPGRGIYLSSTNTWIKFGQYAQDIVSILGSSFTNFQDSNHRYLNYFNLGLDFILNLNSSLVRIILHTNMPGRYDFGAYNRCFFCLRENIVDANENDLDNPAMFLTNLGTSSTKNEVEAKFGKSLKTLPIERTKWRKTGETFDSSEFMVYNNVVFEFMPNGYLTSVQLNC